MDSITNSFTELALDNEKGSRTPPYSPTPLTPAEIAFVHKADQEMKSSFRPWVLSSKYRTNAPRVTVPLDTSNTLQFPALGSSSTGTSTQPKNAWGKTQTQTQTQTGKTQTGKTQTQTFAKMVADLAEREQNAMNLQKLKDAEEQRRRISERVAIPVCIRHRRTLEEILTEDDTHYDTGFDDDHYETKEKDVHSIPDDEE